MKKEHEETIEENEAVEETGHADEINDLKDILQRLQAEFENFRKRTEKEKLEFCRYAGRDMILEFLPVFDNLELALKNTEDKAEFEKGIRIVHSQFKKLLSDLGVKEMSCLGERFDPHLHEALMKEHGREASHVTEEFQKGYMLHDKVLRHAKVKVGEKDDNKGKPERGDTEEGEGLQ